MKYIAVRLKNIRDSKVAFGYKESHQHKRELIDSNIEKRDPALKNLVNELFDRGLAYTVDNCSLYWLQIKDENSLEYYLGKNEVEVVFESQWFEEQKARIRNFNGINYVEACGALADQFTLKNQEREIDYEI